jgi:hypothetical protein
MVPAYESGARVRVGRSGEPGTVATDPFDELPAWVTTVRETGGHVYRVLVDAGYTIYCGERVLRELPPEDDLTEGK